MLLITSKIPDTAGFFFFLHTLTVVWHIYQTGYFTHVKLAHFDKEQSKEFRGICFFRNQITLISPTENAPALPPPGFLRHKEHTLHMMCCPSRIHSPPKLQITVARTGVLDGVQGAIPHISPTLTAWMIASFLRLCCYKFLGTGHLQPPSKSHSIQPLHQFDCTGCSLHNFLCKNNAAAGPQPRKSQRQEPKLLQETWDWVKNAACTAENEGRLVWNLACVNKMFGSLTFFST